MSIHISPRPSRLFAQNLIIAGVAFAASTEFDGTSCLQVDSATATSSLSHSVPSVPSGKNRVFYNLYVDTLNNASRVSRIVREQLLHLDPEVHHLQMISIGAVSDPSILAIDNLQVMKDGDFLHLPDGQEDSTLQELWSYCSFNRTDPSEVVVYLHSKGSFHYKPVQNGWREYLQVGALSDECRLMPKTCNTCGSRVSPLPFTHLPGNMWAARCGYISKLIQPKLFQSAMDEVLEKRQRNKWADRFCPQPGGEADNCYGVGRFSNEHWVLSHPEAQPCDLDSNPDYAWGQPNEFGLQLMDEFVRNVDEVKQLQPAPRGDMSKYQVEGTCTTCGEDGKQRLDEYRILYDQEPPDNWWGWKFFELQWIFALQLFAALFQTQVEANVVHCNEVMCNLQEARRAQFGYESPDRTLRNSLRALKGPWSHSLALAMEDAIGTTALLGKLGTAWSAAVGLLQTAMVQRLSDGRLAAPLAAARETNWC
eukprot:s361_g14.t1